MPLLSNRARSAPCSPVRKLAPLIIKAKASGVHVHEVNIGQPDTPTSEAYFKAIKEFNQRPVSYEPASGSQMIREAWSSFYSRIQGADIDPKEFIITSGGSEGLFFTIAAIADPGEEIIVFEPTYANYIGIAEMVGVKLIGVPTSFHDNFQPPSLEIIKKLTSPKTKGILFCNPGNPTGVSISDSLIQQIIEWAEANSLWVISDECYREIIFNGSPHKTLRAQNKDHIIVIDSVSKRASLCGARIGCVISSNKAVQTAVSSFASQRISISSVEQFAVSAVLASMTKESLASLAKLFFERAESFKKGIKPYSNILVGNSDGAFYTIIEFKHGKADDFAEFLLAEFRQDRETVCITPAHGFYLNSQYGIRQARVAFVLEKNLMERVGKIIGEGYQAFQTEVLKNVS